MKKQKGEYGYIPYRRKRVMIRTFIYFLISLSLYFVGYSVTKTNANILTIVAILGILPASKSMVEAIMFCKIKEIKQVHQEEISRKLADKTKAYDLFLTAYSKNFPISCVVVSEKKVVAYTENQTCDLPAAEKHIQDILSMNSISCEVMVFHNLEQFLNETSKLAPQASDDTSQKEVELLNIIKAISL